MRRSEEQWLRSDAEEQRLLCATQWAGFFGSVLHRPRDLLPLTPEIQKGKGANPGVLCIHYEEPNTHTEAGQCLSSISDHNSISAVRHRSQPRKGLKCWRAQNVNVSALAPCLVSGKRTLENPLEEKELGKKKVGVR